MLQAADGLVKHELKEISSQANAFYRYTTGFYFNFMFAMTVKVKTSFRFIMLFLETTVQQGETSLTLDCVFNHQY